MQEFIHLNVHSHYSISESLITIPTAVDKAIADGMKGMALTDNGVMYGIKEFWDYCKTVNRARQHEGLEPFKPILGCEMYVARRGDKSLKDSIEDKGGWRLTVLAKNLVGYRNLMKLVSRSWVDGLNEYPRTDYKDLAELREGLIITTAGISGEVSTKILRGNLAGAEERVKWFRDIWGDDFYIELRRHVVSNPVQKANRNIAAWEKRCEPTLISLARKYGVKIIGTNNCHFLNEVDAEAHDHLYCLKEEKELDDPTRIIFSKQEWLKTQEEMNRVFSNLPEALNNTIEILDKVELYDIESSPLLPEFHIPESFGTVEEWRNRFSIKELMNEFGYDALGENATDEKYALRIITSKFGNVENLYRIKLEADYLAELAYKGAERLYGTLTQQIEERLRFELHQIKNYAFSKYFLIVQDIVNAAQKELNVWVGPGRGSAVGCLVNYCLGITKVDPLKFGLLFERFFRLNHVSLPDIDIDFDVEGREKVLQWIKDKYGHENCAHIATFSKFSSKFAIKEIARLENLPMEQVHALCRAIPDGLYSRSTLKQLIDEKNDNGKPEYPVLFDAYNSNDTRESNTIKYACQIEGLTAGVGTHACGFVISPKAITNYVPLMAQGSIDCYGEMADVIQYDRRAIESTGLVVFDFLGLYSLDTMKECVRLIKQNHGIELDLYNIPLDDELTLKLFQEGRTVGVFQFDYEGMKEYLKELKPTTFSDLIALISMYHPGSADYIPYLIARKNGQEPVTYDLPIMEKYLKETYGIIAYQEQVMHLAREIGGLSRYQSDVVRKAMGLRKYDIVNTIKPRFIEGGVKNGYDAKILKKIWSDWEKIASYAFNKSHAVAYTQLAYQTAYLKAHYPAEYMSSMLSSGRLSQRQRNEYLDECKSMGIQLLPLDVNKSVLEFAPENDNTIRFGFIGITEIYDDVADEIIRCRNNGGAFKTIFDFAQRVNREICDKSIFETLAKTGAFDCFGLPREQYLGISDKGKSSIDLIFAYASIISEQELFEVELPKLPIVNLRPMDRYLMEKELLGFSFSPHPLVAYQNLYADKCNAKCETLSLLSNFEEYSFIEVAGLVMKVETCKSRETDSEYGAITIEDESGTADFVLWSDTWDEFKTILSMCHPVVIRGYVEHSLNDSIHVDKVYDLESPNIDFVNVPNAEELNKVKLSVKVTCTECFSGVQKPEFFNEGTLQFLFWSDIYKEGLQKPDCFSYIDVELYRGKESIGSIRGYLNQRQKQRLCGLQRETEDYCGYYVMLRTEEELKELSRKHDNQ